MSQQVSNSKGERKKKLHNLYKKDFTLYIRVGISIYDIGKGGVHECLIYNVTSQSFCCHNVKKKCTFGTTTTPLHFVYAKVFFMPPIIHSTPFTIQISILLSTSINYFGTNV